MLAGKLALHDVRDVEGLCARIAQRSAPELSWHEREDLGAYLVATAWELSRRYEPGGANSFSTWATTTLQRRLVDWRRAKDGRSVWRFGDGTVYERPRPELVSLDPRLEQALAEGGGRSCGRSLCRSRSGTRSGKWHKGSGSRNACSATSATSCGLSSSRCSSRIRQARRRRRPSGMKPRCSALLTHRQIVVRSRSYGAARSQIAPDSSP